MKINEEVQYIWHDGATIPENLLINMAKTAGTYDGAKPYLFSLLAHGVMHGISDYINKVNEIREQYNVQPIPVPGGMEDMPKGRKKNEKSPEDMAREKYKLMDEPMKNALLKTALGEIADMRLALINKKAVWIGVYHVVHDRLDGGIVKNTFYATAKAIEPDNWPAKFRISEDTMSNYAHHISCKDSLEAYFDMDENPFEELCEAFWEVLLRMILTNAYE